MKSHLKRLAAPKTWPIERKQSKFITRPIASGHTMEMSMPISILLKDILGHASTSREVVQMLQNKEILVDGKKVKEPKYPVGLMDTLSIKETGENYRMLIDTKGKLFLKPVKSASSKVCRIAGKSTVTGGKTQISLHDGRTALVTGEFNRGDSVLVTLPGQEIKSRLALQKKASVLLTGGKHIGHTGTIEEVSSQRLVVKIGEEVVETLKKFAFVIDREAMEI